MVVEFGTPHLGACQILAPVLESVSSVFSGQVRIAKLDVDSNPKTSRSYGIQSLPVLLIFKQGRVVDHITGVVSKQVLTDKLNALLVAETPDK